MKPTNKNPSIKRHTILASAITALLSMPIYAADTDPSTRHYDKTIDIAAWHDQKSSYKLRASEVIGRTVHNAQNEKIGEIDDLIVAREGDKLLAVLSLGGFFDFDPKLVTVPYQDLRVTTDGENLYYDATKEVLEGKAGFTYADPDERVENRDVERKAPVAASSPDNSAEKHDEPVAAKNVPGADKAADNSVHNVRDRSDAALTPLDQSNTKADVDITRKIRQGLVDDDSLGTNAQNVKVITVDGTVTLRGAVGNTVEHARIVAVAKNTAGIDRVKDELEVIKQ